MIGNRQTYYIITFESVLTFFLYDIIPRSICIGMRASGACAAFVGARGEQRVAAAFADLYNQFQS